jgi:parallel beta-helix repeat protein
MSLRAGRGWGRAPGMFLRRGTVIVAALLLRSGDGFCRSPVALSIEHDTVLESDWRIGKDETCTIRPGVTVLVRGYREIIVEGALIAAGTATKRIVFSGVGRERGSDAAPCWGGLTFSGKNARGLFKYCRIEGAYRNLAWESSPEFDSCEFAGNHFAIYCTRRSAAHVKNCFIYRNAYGVVADCASPILMGNAISENAVGVYLQLSASVVAGRNRIEGNKTDIASDESMGENATPLKMQFLWDLVRQLY